jgi:hypothetical protein
MDPMGKRYVFSRMPTGQPYRGNDGKHAPESILADLGSKSLLSPEGGVSWTGFTSKRYEVALRSAFVILDPYGDELNEVDMERIVWEALIAMLKAAPSKAIKPSEFLAKADELAAAFFRKPIQRYVLVSSLSLADLPAKRIKIRDHVITPLARRGKRYPIPSVLQAHAHRASFGSHLDSTGYRLLKITTSGRSIFQAVGAALEALHLLRGLWSLFATYGSWSFSLGGPERKRLGVIHTGPVHTLHLPDGTAAEDSLYWYEAEYTEDQPLFKHKDWAKIETQRRWAMRRLACLEHRKSVEDLLVRYAIALDQPNADIAFLKMWGILEKITNTVGAKYDETIKRVIWIYSKSSRGLAKDVLESLRNQRNQYVHSGTSATESDQVAYLVKSFVDPHLARLLSNRVGVRSLEEYGEYLAMPTDVSALQQQRRMIVRALTALRQKDQD